MIVALARWLQVALVVVGVLVISRPARANDVAAAEALFREGRRLMDAGNYAGACDKFADSQRLDPSSGTLINLASCHETLGLTATAWAEFLAAARMANAQQHFERAAEAERRASALEPRVSYLTISVELPPPGLVVERNGVRVFDSAFGFQLPVDPGEHTVRASAPGYEAWTSTVAVGEAASKYNVDVPPLTPVPPPAPAVVAAAPPSTARTAPSTEPPPRSTQQPEHPLDAPPDQAASGSGTLGPAFWAAAGTAVAATGVGAVFGVLSLQSYADAEDRCPTHTDCDQRTLDLEDRAHTQANVANVALGTAVVAVVVAGWLYFSTDAAPAPSARLPTSPLSW